MEQQEQTVTENSWDAKCPGLSHHCRTVNLYITGKTELTAGGEKLTKHSRTQPKIRLALLKGKLSSAVVHCQL